VLAEREAIEAPEELREFEDVDEDDDDVSLRERDCWWFQKSSDAKHNCPTSTTQNDDTSLIVRSSRPSLVTAHVTSTSRHVNLF
jgi:hypothetical protein